MKTKKFLAMLLVLCMVLGCMSITALAEDLETIALGESKVISVPCDDGEGTDVYQYYYFTPDESGTYAFSVDYDESVEFWHTFNVFPGNEIDYTTVENGMIFEAEAGVTYELVMNYWGVYTQEMEYTVSIQECQPVESIGLEADADWGYVGNYLDISVIFEPEFYIPEEITWEVSDSDVAVIESSYNDYADLILLAPGTVTVTATTASGLEASVEVTVVDVPDSLELLEDVANPVSVAVNSYQPISFTPSESGYYLLTLDADYASCYLYEVGWYSEDGDIYLLEAGVTYEGEVYTYGDEDVDCNIYITKTQVLSPVAMEITKEPDNTTVLRSTLDYVDAYSLMAGMEMEITWSDGSKTTWSFDEDEDYLGYIYYLGYELNWTGDSSGELVLSYDDLSVTVDITIVDLEAVSIEPVNSDPIQIVENSCGLSDLLSTEDDVESSSWYYLLHAGYLQEVTITFSDGSTVNAMPGDYVYGEQVYCGDSQFIEPWVKGGDNWMYYAYMDLYAEVPVEIIDSPVESIELAKLPNNTTLKLDEGDNLITSNGEMVESIRDLYEGMSLTVNYKDGTSKTFGEDDIQWIDLMGMEYPVIDGYPIGIFGGMLLMEEAPTAPCECEGYVEYMGASTTYVIKLVEEFEPEEDTGDEDTGSEDTGNEDTGSDDTGSDNTGNDNTGSDNTGNDNTGSDNTGNDNTGNDNTGSDNTDTDTDTDTGDGKDDVVIEPSPDMGDGDVLLFIGLAMIAATAVVLLLIDRKKII